MSIRYRVIPWGNPTIGARKYGLQASVEPRIWLHVCEGQTVPLFDTAQEAKAEIARLRTRPEVSQAVLATLPAGVRPVPSNRSIGG